MTDDIRPLPGRVSSVFLSLEAGDLVLKVNFTAAATMVSLPASAEDAM